MYVTRNFGNTTNLIRPSDQAQHLITLDNLVKYLITPDNLVKHLITPDNLVKQIITPDNLAQHLITPGNQITWHFISAFIIIQGKYIPVIKLKKKYLPMLHICNTSGLFFYFEL